MDKIKASRVKEYRNENSKMLQCLLPKLAYLIFRPRVGGFKTNNQVFYPPSTTISSHFEERDTAYDYRDY